MVFRTIRFILLAVSIGLALKYVWSSHFKKKRMLSIISVMGCILVITLTAMFPIENLIIDFKTPESVFSYMDTGSPEKVLYGVDSCAVIYRRRSETGFRVILKTDSGYRIPTYFTPKRISSSFFEAGIVEVYQVRGSEDYYVFIAVPATNSSSEAFMGNEFEKYRLEDSTYYEEQLGGFRYIYIYLNKPVGNYYLTVNGETVSVDF